MRALWLFIGLGVVLTVIWVNLGVSGQTVYFGGPILTMDPGSRVVEALGVEGDRIAIVGSEAQVRSWAKASARVVDLDGRALLPGFVDAHGHFPGEGVWAVVADLNSPPIGSVRRIADLVERLKMEASETDAGDWVIGMGYDDSLIEERRHPTRMDLDAVSDSHPVVVIHVSGHLAVANSAALAELGIDASSPDPEGGRIRRLEDGEEPSGVLEEEAMRPVLARVMAPSLLDSWRIVREAIERALRAGVTTVQNGLASKFQLRALDWASRLGVIPVRIVAWPDAETAQEMLDGSFSFSSHDESWFRVGAVKLVADGSIQGYTGYLSLPYHVGPPDEPGGYRGYPRIPRDRLRERVAAFHAAGLQVAVHGNGDAAIDDILAAFEHAASKHPRDDARPVIIHAQMARPDQLDRMAKLGVIPSFFSLHTFYWGDRHRQIFMGPERAARMSPARSARDRGVRFTIHCDAPVVPMEPLRLAGAAVQRRTRSGFVVGPDERITVMEALRAVTIEPAYQHFEEALKGSLEPGKLADLVILSENPLESGDRLDELRVIETIVGGRTAWKEAER